MELSLIENYKKEKTVASRMIFTLFGRKGKEWWRYIIYFNTIVIIYFFYCLKSIKNYEIENH